MDKGNGWSEAGTWFGGGICGTQKSNINTHKPNTKIKKSIILFREVPSSPYLWDRQLLQKLSWDIRQTRTLSPGALGWPESSPKSTETSEPDASGTQEEESLGLYCTLLAYIQSSDIQLMITDGVWLTFRDLLMHGTPRGWGRPTKMSRWHCRLCPDIGGKTGYGCTHDKHQCWRDRGHPVASLLVLCCSKSISHDFTNLKIQPIAEWC